MAGPSLFHGVAVFLVLSGGMSAAVGQAGPDELRSNWQIGEHRGSVHLRIPDTEKGDFRAFMDRFARERSFVKMASADGPVLSGRGFISDWYGRTDGVTIFVTDISAPEKMRVIFYGRKGGEGTAAAEQALSEFRSLGSRFRKYE